MTTNSKTYKTIELNDVENVAVISIPRTGSKSLVNTIAEIKNKEIKYGILHKPEYLGKVFTENEVAECVFSKKYILHGHWHTLHLLQEEIQEFIKKNYAIVSVIRDHQMILKSVNRLLVQTLGLKIANNDIEKKVNQIIEDSYKVMNSWPIYKVFSFEELYKRK